MMVPLSHSPLPWTPYECDDSESWEIDHGADGSLDCALSKQDAELICRCVNAHEELLQTCKVLLTRELEVIGSAGSPFMVDESVVAMARAAIQKAEPGDKEKP